MNPMMMFISRLLSRLSGDKDGQALVEYALILALVAVVVIVVLHFLGGSVSNTLNNVGSAVSVSG